MPRKDEALALPNARLLSAVYFGLLAIIATIIIDTSLYLMGIGELIPTFKAVLLATAIAVGFGALFGEKIIHCRKPYRVTAFKWGFLMVLIALPVYDLFFLWMMHGHHPETFRGASITEWMGIYLIMLAYSFVLVGFWLALIAGIAAIYLRGHLVYDIMHSDKNEEVLMSRRKKHKPEKLLDHTVKHR